jgi:D-alanyl-D-alanine carboxypeptidase (penicillin-binding protein 5/6)
VRSSRTWWWWLWAALCLAPALAQPEAEEDDSLVPPANVAQPKASPPDPRAAAGPKPSHLAPPGQVGLRSPLEPHRADGKPFTCVARGLVDVETGQILYSSNLTKRVEPASLTKIMTTLLTLEALQQGQVKLTDMAVISKEAATTPESGLWLQIGEHISVRDLLVGIMVRSANDAAYAMAELLSGGQVQRFVDRMNGRARELGCVDTHFINPHGLHMDLERRAANGDQHYTTAYDLLLMTYECWRYPLFRQLCLLDREPVSWQQMDNDPAKKHPPYRIVPNRNKLLKRYPECVGIKTGFTHQAGACLLSAALRGDRCVLAVTMHSVSGEDRWQEAEALLRFGLDQFERRTVVSAGQAVAQIPVLDGTAPSVSAVAGETVTLVLPRALGAPRTETQLAPSLSAPLLAGMPVGQLLLTLPTGQTHTVGLTAAQSVDRVGLGLSPAVGGGLGVLLVLAGVVGYGALAEADSRGGRVLAACGRGPDHRRPGQGQRPGSDPVGQPGRADGPD